eukprot:CAMPEP_0202874490 /NCGR_PEP_ID=MMETSP1391-20130828/25510_1 /ASSEMBLY_ACC=CAM_ASM_000867 /TAXON_ID=1034604 /ORGANISM="Chlamydomonas leiostraca, Strain SAG 11-49" /LENGTH=123 /DNA_ID=CAMNT_0049555937 /DNA_START=247 /DNA_END=615 /DNA_ORIENTATION=+
MAVRRAVLHTEKLPTPCCICQLQLPEHGEAVRHVAQLLHEPANLSPIKQAHSWHLCTQQQGGRCTEHAVHCVAADIVDQVVNRGLREEANMSRTTPHPGWPIAPLCACTLPAHIYGLAVRHNN